MASIFAFPDKVQRIHRVIFIAFFSLVIDVNVPLKARLELLGSVLEHSVLKFGKGH